ncbi:hypothetical protein SISNIDRAFT_455434 [Sistotremastrum niveocremeum HHB9708]|uniref:Zn(2)-C6 fungal-type domain-containing protein n=1 Tax=Sistotremastrum niveocremeum HHB9708 TaxID=1314777 RepID=A0A164U0R2_9AGAM|nr:hypothetical protein SISNIDRAFT_455434 [Sistotremastrum niveocremeum HHB9708]
MHAHAVTPPHQHQPPPSLHPARADHTQLKPISIQNYQIKGQPPPQSVAAYFDPGPLPPPDPFSIESQLAAVLRNSDPETLSVAGLSGALEQSALTYRYSQNQATSQNQQQIKANSKNGIPSDVSETSISTTMPSGVDFPPSAGQFTFHLQNTPYTNFGPVHQQQVQQQQQQQQQILQNQAQGQHQFRATAPRTFSTASSDISHHSHHSRQSAYSQHSQHSQSLSHQSQHSHSQQQPILQQQQQALYSSPGSLDVDHSSGYASSNGGNGTYFTSPYQGQLEHPSPSSSFDLSGSESYYMPNQPTNSLNGAISQTQTQPQPQQLQNNGIQSASINGIPSLNGVGINGAGPAAINGVNGTNRSFLVPHPTAEDYILVPGGKRRRKTTTDEFGVGEDEDEEDEDDEPQTGADARNGRLGACQNCKRLKVKCDRTKGSVVCRKCAASGQDCTIPNRKPRKAPAKRGDLMDQIHQRDQLIRDKDALIQQLLNQFESRSSAVLSLPNPYAASASSPGPGAPSPAASAVKSPDEEQREKEIQEWIDKARATLNSSSGLLGGDFNAVVEDASDDGEDDDQTEGGYQAANANGANGIEEDEDLLNGKGDEDSGDEESKRQEKAHVIPSAAPLGFIAAESIKKKRTRRGSSVGVQEADEVGLANESFFRPTANPSLHFDSETQNPPEIMTRGLVSVKEVKELFDTYFQDMNLSVSLLDPAVYTPEKTFSRSPFLFTVICATASRFMPNRHDLYRTLMSHAQLCAGGALISGKKCVESVQAYILMALYPIPARRWSQDRSWMYLGCAIRMATDLNLHHPPSMSATGETATTHASIDHTQQEAHAREVLNRTRAWLTCYNLDKSAGMQLGKPLTIRDDWVAPLLEKNIEALGDDWWCGTPFGFKFDLHICAYNALLRVIARFHQTIFSDISGGVNKTLPLEEVTQGFEDEIEKLGQKWFNHIGRLTPPEDTQLVFRLDLLRLEYSYNRLVALSFGFQHAFHKIVPGRESAFLDRCYRAATETLNIIINDLAPKRYLRYGPESYSIFATFASAFLLKLLRPKFSNWLQAQRKEEILELVGKLIEALNTIAIDERHVPRLYARFLDGLLAKAKKSTRGSSASASSPSATLSGSSKDPSVSPNMQSAALFGELTNNGNADQLFDMSGTSNSMTGHPNMGSYATVNTGSAHLDPHTQMQQEIAAGGFAMNGFDDGLPVHDPVQGYVPADEKDLLAGMTNLGDRFWDNNIFWPGFSQEMSVDPAQLGMESSSFYGNINGDYSNGMNGMNGHTM